MKARRVKGIDPRGEFRAGAARIAALRHAELLEHAPAALAGDDVALHDLRIAAKRLRYALELAEGCLGDPARAGARRARALQDLLGEIHDCDVLLPVVDEHAGALRAADVAALRTEADGSGELAPAALAQAPNAERHAGLALLAVYLRARRETLYARFVEEWDAHPFELGPVEAGAA